LQRDHKAAGGALGIEFTQGLFQSPFELLGPLFSGLAGSFGLSGLLGGALGLLGGGGCLLFGLGSALSCPVKIGLTRIGDDALTLFFKSGNLFLKTAGLGDGFSDIDAALSQESQVRDTLGRCGLGDGGLKIGHSLLGLTQGRLCVANSG
jgi:hypothetical protein